MGVPANTGPVLNVGPAAAAAEQQLNPPRSFDVVWSLNHADDVGERACPPALEPVSGERPSRLILRDMLRDTPPVLASGAVCLQATPVVLPWKERHCSGSVGWLGSHACPTKCLQCARQAGTKSYAVDERLAYPRMVHICMFLTGLVVLPHVGVTSCKSSVFSTLRHCPRNTCDVPYGAAAHRAGVAGGRRHGLGGRGVGVRVRGGAPAGGAGNSELVHNREIYRQQ